MILQYICFKVVFFYFPPVNASSMAGFWIQGTRSSVSSPWLTEDGDELPYIGPNYSEFNWDRDSPPLEMSFDINNRFIAMPADLVNAIICEIWRLFFSFDLIFPQETKSIADLPFSMSMLLLRIHFWFFLLYVSTKCFKVSVFNMHISFKTWILSWKYIWIRRFMLSFLIVVRYFWHFNYVKLNGTQPKSIIEIKTFKYGFPEMSYLIFGSNQIYRISMLPW